MSADPNAPLWLSDEHLAALGLTASRIADEIEETLMRGGLHTAPKPAVAPGDGRYIVTTLATADDPALIVAKTVALSPGNPARDLPAVNGAVLLLDGATGRPRALLDGAWITAARTAAMSLVAARRLAGRDARCIAFLGCGAQARSHLAAFAAEFALREVRAFGRGARAIRELTGEARARDLSMTACATAEEALRGADIVVSALPTTYDGPVLARPDMLGPGAFATLIDQGRAWGGIADFDTLVIDDHAQEAAAPARLVPADRVAADLGDLVAGAGPGPDRAGRTAFVFRGSAAADFAAATLAYARATAAVGPTTSPGNDGGRPA